METPTRAHFGPVTYRFGDIEVDVAAYEARRDGRRIPLTRQPMEVLLLLLERRGELVTREDIAKRLWAPDVFTDMEAGIRTAVLKIRQGLQDSREPPRFVETVAGKGYRFVASVEVVSHAPPGSDSRSRGGHDSGHNLPAELTSFVGRQAEPCSPAARDRRSRGTGHSRRPWTGVTSCSRSPNARCFVDSRCSTVGGRSAPAEHVCAGHGVDLNDVFDLLSRLVDKSLVVVDSAVKGERRYRLLETVRQYARERLVRAGDDDRLCQRHFDFFFQEYRAARLILSGPGQLALLRRLRIEQENVRAALDWALASGVFVEAGVELAGALFWYWTKRGQFEEGRLWLERALAAEPRVSGSLRARALVGLGNIAYFQGVDASPHVAEALSLGRRTDDPWVVSQALFIQSLVALERGDREEAVARAVEAREAANAGGCAVELGPPLFVLGHVAASNGDHDRAQQLYDEAIDVLRRAGEHWGMGIILVAAAATRIVRNDYEPARAQASQALSLFQELEDPRGVAWTLEICAGLLAADDKLEEAARLRSAATEQRDRIGAALPSNLRVIRDRYMEPVRTALGDARFEVACEDGRAMALGDAIAFARDEALVHH